MTIDSMRVGGGRCPLLVGGLAIACILMIGNWWTLSSTNLELLRQIDELNEQIKISVEERDQCVTLRENTDKQLRSSQDEARTAHVKLSQVEVSLTTCNQEIESFKQNSLTMNATLNALRIAKNKTLNAKTKENQELKEELDKVKDELEKAKLAMNAPPPKPVPVIPIANPAKLDKPPHLGPVKLSAVEVSVEGQRGMKYHGVPILPQDPAGAVRLTPRYSVVKIKPKLLEKPDTNKTVNIGGNQGNAAVNKTVNTGANQAPNPQMNAPPNAENVDAQEAQEKDASNLREDNAAERDDGNEQEFPYNVISDQKNRDNQR